MRKPDLYGIIKTVIKMEDYLIRQATAEDAAALLKIYAYYVENTSATFEYQPPSLEDFTGRIIRAGARYPYLVIESELEILGFAFAHAFRERPAYDYAAEVTIYLRHDMRHRGLGRAIYTALEAELGRMGVRSLYACVAIPSGEDDRLSMDSPRFHEALGYRRCAEFRNVGWKFDTWYAMVWMEKVIGDFPADPEPLTPYPELLMNTPQDIPEKLSDYDDRPVRLVTEDGEMFIGLCNSFPASYGELVYNWSEEGVRLDSRAFFKSQIIRIDPIE